jgi:hypothetical protein
MRIPVLAISLVVIGTVLSIIIILANLPSSSISTLSPHDRALVEQIIETEGKNLKLFPIVISVRFERLETTSETEKIIYLTGYTIFNIPWNKAMIFHEDGRVIGGHVVGYRESVH